ncbi:TonB-dependent receptor plug domain-containing protein [Bacteroidota bacterium]
MDSKTGDVIPFAHVCFFGLDDQSEKYRVTNDEGFVNAELKGQIKVAISFVGYQALIDTIEGGSTHTLELVPSVFNMNEVVVTAQYTPQRIDKSIYKVKLISRKQIEYKGANNLPDLLGSELNMRVSQDGALGSSLSLQGLSGEHIKFLIDGVPVIGRMNGNIDISQLNLYNVDHIEVIEGPMSVVYGSNALAGVINIITKENKNGKIRGNLNSYAESVGVFNLDGLLAFNKKKHSISVSGGRNFFGGFSDNKSLRSQRWKPKIQYNTDAYYLFNSNKVKFKISANYFNENLWNKGNLQPPYYEFAFDNYYITNRLTARTDLSVDLNKNRFFSFLAAYSFYGRRKESYYKDMTTLEEQYSINSSDQDTTRFDSYMTRGTYSKSDKKSPFNYQMGYDINLETGSGKRITGKEQFIGDYAAYLSVQYEPLSIISVQPGIRYIYNTRYNAPLVYSLNAKLDILEQLSARASYSTGFRAPSLKELYLYFVDVNHNIRGNEDLKAEESQNINVGLNYFRENKKHYYGMEANIFYNNINNIITLAVVKGDIYTYINVDKYITQGFQFNVKYKFYPNIEVKVGLSETGRYNSLSSQISGSKKFVYTTDFITDLHYNILKYNLTFSLYYKYSGEIPQFYLDENNNVLEGYISDYNTMDFSIQKGFFGNKFQVTTGLKNIFNNTVIPAVGGSGGVHSGGGGTSYAIGWGRTAFIKLSYNFLK